MSDITGSSSCGAWVFFMILFGILMLVYPPLLGLFVGIAGTYVVIWIICKVVFGDSGQIF